MAHYLTTDRQRLYAPAPMYYGNRASVTRKWWTPIDEAERKKFESCKADIKTFLTITKDGINVRRAYGEMADSMEGEIPYKKLRFNNFGEFLFHCDDILEVRTDGTNYYLFLRGRPDQEAKHLRELVVGQERGRQKGFRARVTNTRPVQSDVLTHLLRRSELDVCKPPPSMRGRRGGRGRGRGRGRGGVGRGGISRNVGSNLPPRLRPQNSLPELRPYNPNDYARPPVKAVQEVEFDDEEYYEEDDDDDWDYSCPQDGCGSDGEDFVDSCQNNFAQKTVAASNPLDSTMCKSASISRAAASSATKPSVFSRLGPIQSESVKMEQPLRTVQVKSQAQKNIECLTSSVASAIPAAASKSQSFNAQTPSISVSSTTTNTRSALLPTPTVARKPLLPTPTVATSAFDRSTTQVTRVPAATLVESRASTIETSAMATKTSVQHAVPQKPSPAPSKVSCFQAPKTSSTTNVILPATSVTKSNVVGSSAATSRTIYYQAVPTNSYPSHSTFKCVGTNSAISQDTCDSIASKSAAVKENSNTMSQTSCNPMWVSGGKYSATQQNGMFTSAMSEAQPAPKPLSALTLSRTYPSKADMKSHPMNPFAAKINGLTSSFGTGGFFQATQRNDMTSGSSQNAKSLPQQKVSCDNSAKGPTNSDTPKNILKENNVLAPLSKSGAEVLKPSPKNILARQMNIPKDKEFDARLIGADGFGFFFIHLLNHDICRGYEQLRKEIRDFYSSKDIQESYRLNPSEIQVGMMVIAKVGGTYVRAQIDEKDAPSGLCIIFELEDHSFETVKFENLYQIEKKFSVRCSQAIMCCLSGLENHMMTGDIADAFETTPLYPPVVKVKWIRDSSTYGLPVVQMTIFEDQDVCTLIKKYGGRHLKELKTEAEKVEHEKFQQHQIDILRGKFYVM